MPNSFSRPSIRANTAAAWCGTCWTCLAGHHVHISSLLENGTITLRDLNKLQSVADRSKMTAAVEAYLHEHVTRTMYYFGICICRVHHTSRFCM
jgi:NADH:ubiquinone oxidoreductase subunit F (NADH-binding)